MKKDEIWLRLCSQCGSLDPRERFAEGTATDAYVNSDAWACAECASTDFSMVVVDTSDLTIPEAFRAAFEDGRKNQQNT